MNDDKQMIQNPDRWPMGFFLPVKKENPKGGFSIVGFMVDHTGLRNTIFEGNMYTYLEDQKPLKDFPRHEYETVDQLLTAGWRVD